MCCGLYIVRTALGHSLRKASYGFLNTQTDHILAGSGLLLLFGTATVFHFQRIQSTLHVHRGTPFIKYYIACYRVKALTFKMCYRTDPWLKLWSAHWLHHSFNLPFDPGIIQKYFQMTNGQRRKLLGRKLQNCFPWML